MPQRNTPARVSPGWLGREQPRPWLWGREGGIQAPLASGTRGGWWWQLSQAAAHPGRAQRRLMPGRVKSLARPCAKALLSSGAQQHGGGWGGGGLWCRRLSPPGAGGGAEWGHKVGKPQPPSYGQGGGCLAATSSTLSSLPPSPSGCCWQH